MGLFEDKGKASYDGAASRLVAVGGDMSKLTDTERDRIETLKSESGARGNKVRSALGL